MSDVERINTNAYVTVQGHYAVTNEGTGYAIINIQTEQIVAHNISSFLDCVKTLEYLLGKSESQDQSLTSNSVQLKVPNFNVREDVQQLIEAYAPTTTRVEKEVNWNRSKYKCYDRLNNYLGQVKGKLGDRYWKDPLGNKYRLR